LHLEDALQFLAPGGVIINACGRKAHSAYGLLDRLNFLMAFHAFSLNFLVLLMHCVVFPVFCYIFNTIFLVFFNAVPYNFGAERSGGYIY